MDKLEGSCEDRLHAASVRAESDKQKVTHEMISIREMIEKQMAQVKSSTKEV